MNRIYKFYEYEQKQKHSKRKKRMRLLRDALKSVAPLLSPGEYHKLCRGVMCTVLKIRLKRSIRELVTEFESNKGYRDMCKLKSCPGKSAIHNYLKDLQAKYKDIFEQIVQAMAHGVAGGLLVGDSTGYGTRKYIKWQDVKKSGSRHDFVKLHILANEYNFIVAFTGTKGTQHDSPVFETLCKYIPEGDGPVILDAGYDSNKNCELIIGTGHYPVIKPKKNYVIRGFNARCKMLIWYDKDRDGFMEVYNKRNRVESIFASMKMKCGDIVYAKKHEYQMVELFARVLYHNLTA